jgi:hypothetical protein
MDGKITINWTIDKSPDEVARYFNQQWLRRYPGAKYIFHDNGSEVKLCVESLCNSFRITRKPTTVKNPQVNANLKYVHGVLGNMVHTNGLDISPTTTYAMITESILNVAWSMCSTYHAVLKSTPGAAIFVRDVLFNTPYIADSNDIGHRR